jgi:hypothetical protein
LKCYLSQQASKQANKQTKQIRAHLQLWLARASIEDSKTPKKLTKMVRSNRLPATERPLLGYPATAVRPVNQDKVKKNIP